MRCPRVSLGVVILLACTAAWLGQREVATQSSTSNFSYAVIDVGTLGGGTSVANAVGGRGAVVAGTSLTAAGQTHAFARWYMAPLLDLGTFGGPLMASEAFGANRDGYYVVGRAQLASGAYRAFRVSQGQKIMDLGTLGGAESDARDANDHGDVVGASRTADGALRAFIWNAQVDGTGTMALLGATLGGRDSRALGINDARKVVGWAQLSGNAVAHAFLHANGVTTDLTPGAGNSAARAINELDQAVGYVESGGATRAFLYSGGALQQLSTLAGGHTSAYDINDLGAIVGESAVSGVPHAVIWREGQITDLNTLIPADSGWLLKSARSIDEGGYVVGVGSFGGRDRAFLLSPPADLELVLWPHENEIDTNIPKPHEAGQGIDLGVTVRIDGPPEQQNWITGIEITDTLTGPWQYESWDTTVADCTRAGQTLTCRLKRALEPGGRGIDLMIRVRATAIAVPGTGGVTHSATARAAQLDPDTTNNSATESNVAVSLATLALKNSSVTGGTSVSGRVTLTSTAPGGGAYVKLTSSNTDVATVPDPFDVLPWDYDGLARDFWVTTKPVTVPTTVVISARYGLVTKTQELTILPAGTAPDNPPRSLPGTIQAEDFDNGGQNVAYYDTTAGNTGGQYRTTDVDIQATTDSGGGYNVGWIRATEWLRYTVNVATAGQYLLSARVAAGSAGGTFHVEFGGQNKTGTLVVPSTGGWQTWTTITKEVSLAAGAQVMRIAFDTNGTSGGVGNLNWVRLDPVAASKPWGGTPRALPGRIQAEYFDTGGEGVSYHDTTVANIGGQYRNTRVDIEATADTAGGLYNIGWIAAGEWLKYTVNVGSAGTYAFQARVAVTGPGGTFHVESNGASLTGSMTIPSTGGWQQYVTITSRNFSLPAGPQVLRVVFDTPGSTGAIGNLNWIEVVAR